MLKYKLTKDQLRVSNGVTYAIKNNKNVLIYAVCGAGKTEIVYDEAVNYSECWHTDEHTNEAEQTAEEGNGEYNPECG